MATIAELQDALVNADKAGDVEAARQLADAIVAMRSGAQGVSAKQPESGPLAGMSDPKQWARQAGLTARYGIEGLGQVAQVFTEPLRNFVTDPLAKLAGMSGGRPMGDEAASLADMLGLPKPQGANERVVGDVARLMAGAGGLGMAGKAASAAPGMAGKVGQFFAANPTQALVSAGGAGAAGGAVREAGGGPGAQFAASLAGGLAAPLAVGGATRVAQGTANLAKDAKAALTGDRSYNVQQVDQQINLTLRQAGIDWAQVPERIKQSMRDEVAQALRTGGDLDPAAMARLLQFRTVGATPTRGQLTQDPVQITLEKNLAKTGANSADMGLQRLPRLENENTQTLLTRLDEAGAAKAPDAYRTGELAIGSLKSTADASKARINSLYQAARDTSGRSAQLSGGAFTKRASALLDERLLGYAVPESVNKKLNQIATGEVPFTVDFAEQLKTALGDIARADKGGATSKAMSLIRQALDETPLQPAPQVNPGNLPAVPGTVPPSPAVLGEESIKAFGRARQANRAFMQRVEETPALKAVMDGVEPDQFVQKFITGQGATFKDVTQLRKAVAQSPEALNAIKANIVAHLKSKALGDAQDVTKFNASSYTRALNNIGERKLSAFFDPEEIRMLKAVGQVGTYMSAQPAGTAVNNSNSGAMLAAKALEALDLFAGRLPLGVNTTIQGIMRGTQQGAALRTPKALVLPQEQMSALERLANPALMGSLLATQPVNYGQ